MKQSRSTRGWLLGGLGLGACACTFALAGCGNSEVGSIKMKSRSAASPDLAPAGLETARAPARPQAPVVEKTVGGGKFKAVGGTGR